VNDEKSAYSIGTSIGATASNAMRSSENETRQANVALVRELYRAFANRDVDRVLGMLSMDVEWREPVNPFNPSGGVRHGHAGFLEWVRVGQESEEILALEPRQFLADESSVAVVGYSNCRAKTTGRTYESDFVHLISLSDGKIVRFQEFFDTYSAGEAFRI
jgi:ketosteroid isomerase-like protein